MFIYMEYKCVAQLAWTIINCKYIYVALIYNYVFLRILSRDSFNQNSDSDVENNDAFKRNG